MRAFGRWLSALVLLAALLAAPPARAVSTFTVTNTNDSGAGSLRQAIIDANGTANVGGPDVIDFDITGAGPHTIAPTSALPQIGEAVEIDGYCGTCDGAAPNTLAEGNDAIITIQLDGTNGGSDVSGLDLGLGSSGSTIRGLSITGFDVDGIKIGGATATNQTVEGNFIGIDPTGADAGNGRDGVELFIGGHTIGGNTPAARNVISGNDRHGIHLQGSLATATISGNHIGTNPAGTGAVANGNSGISLASVVGATVGGSGAGEGNVVSGNGLYGISISSASQTTVEGNRIGTDATGSAAVPNGSDGVIVNAGSDNTIGGTAAGSGNLISGNTGDGVTLWGDGNALEGNTIGLDATGMVELGNGGAFGAGVTVSSGA
ncbi:MAG TPA: NosD domain-containing protein, partial [Actinomycetota bacterium]|nr:NosD domain-containing protein [Actinomycetota bacterium]